jgi:hypothetical protein
MDEFRELIDALAPADLDLDGEELAEALWLARIIEPEPGSAGAASEPEEPSEPEPDSGPDSAHRDRGAAEPPPDRSPGAALTSGPTEAVKTQGASGAALGTVGVPRIPAVPAKPAVLSALRPLARRTRVPGRRLFDEESTIERSAATRVRWPVTRAGEARDRELALVLDRDPTMAAWEGLASEVREVFAAVGAFRRISVRYAETGRDGRLRLAEHAYAPATEPLSSLRDPQGRRVVVVLTTALGDAWALGTAAADLDRLAQSTPVAVAQPLPSRLWRRTGLDWDYGRLAARVPGRYGPLRIVLTAVERALAAARASAGTQPDGRSGGRLAPIPVFELAAGWLGPWAKLLAGQRTTVRYPLLRLPDPAQQGSPKLTQAQLQDRELNADPVQVVRRFRSASSPEAYRLAVLLSVVSLNPPVMRLIQRVAMPGTAPSVLAEVIAGGLLEPAAANLRPPHGSDEARRLFVFRPGVGEVLRRALRRSESARVLALTSDFVQERYGVPGPLFRATLSQPTAGEGGLPFAYLSVQTLRRLAPHFPAEAAGGVDQEEIGRILSGAHVAATSDDLEQVEASLARCRAALRSLPIGESARAELLFWECMLLVCRHRWAEHRDAGDLDELIGTAKATLAEMPDGSSRANLVFLLGNLLLLRERRTGAGEFVIEAVRTFRAGLATLPEDGAGVHESRAIWFQVTADACRRAAELTQEPIYCTEALEAYRSAILASADESFTALMHLRTVQIHLLLTDLTGEISETRSAEMVGEFSLAILLGHSEIEDFAESVDRVIEMLGELRIKPRMRVELAGRLLAGLVEPPFAVSQEPTDPAAPPRAPRDQLLAETTISTLEAIAGIEIV